MQGHSEAALHQQPMNIEVARVSSFDSDAENVTGPYIFVAQLVRAVVQKA